MDMQEVIEFIPKTLTINSDRKYFRKGNIFIKVDSVVERGKNEANVLKNLDHRYIQKYYNSYIENGNHVLETEFFNGDSLENIKCTNSDKRLIQSQFFEFLSYTTMKEIVHGDINVSNVLFNGRFISILDWETAYRGNSKVDLFGVHKHQGIINVLELL